MFERFSCKAYRRMLSVRQRVMRRFTGAGLAVLAGLGVTAVLGLDIEQSLAYQAFALLACLLVVSSAFALFFRMRFRAERVLPRFGSVGHSFIYRVLVRNDTERVQKGLVLLDRVSNDFPTLEEFERALKVARRQQRSGSLAPLWTGRAVVEPAALPLLPPGGEGVARVQVTPRRRGVLRFDAVTVGRPDPLGLVRGMVTISSVQTMLILPKRYVVPPLALPGTAILQPGGVALASSVGESQEFVFLRDYRRGDPLRHVHWKSWARVGRPIVKEFQNEYFVRHALVLDTYCDSEDEEVFEETVSVAASFACSMQNQESLLDLMFVGAEAYCFTAGRGLGRVDQILEVMASVQSCRERPFETLRDLVVAHAPALSGCICVFQGWDAARQGLVKQIEALSVPVVVLVVSRGGEGSASGVEGEWAGRVHSLEVGRIEEGLARFGEGGIG